MRLYLDTSPVIYTVEQVPGYAAAVDNALSAPGIVLVASDLTRMECRVKPLRGVLRLEARLTLLVGLATGLQIITSGRATPLTVREQPSVIAFSYLHYRRAIEGTRREMLR